MNILQNEGKKFQLKIFDLKEKSKIMNKLNE